MMSNGRIACPTPRFEAVFRWTQRMVATRGFAFEGWSGADAVVLETCAARRVESIVGRIFDAVSREAWSAQIPRRLWEAPDDGFGLDPGYPR